ncbi:hypothetical protein COCC4DRAFT_155360, partial [Bipolaris maydis ATCC 48331]
RDERPKLSWSSMPRNEKCQIREAINIQLISGGIPEITIKLAGWRMNKAIRDLVKTCIMYVRHTGMSVMEG